MSTACTYADNCSKTFAAAGLDIGPKKSWFWRSTFFARVVSVLLNGFEFRSNSRFALRTGIFQAHKFAILPKEVGPLRGQSWFQWIFFLAKT